MRPPFFPAIFLAVLSFCAAAPASAQNPSQPAQKLFSLSSKAMFPSATLDITVAEVERRARSSVIQVSVKTPADSKTPSYFTLCAVRHLALLRGYNAVAKLSDTPAPGLTLVVFLKDLNENPADIEPAFAGQGEKIRSLDLRVFSFCDPGSPQSALPEQPAKR